MQLTLSNVSFSYPGFSALALEGASAVFPRGWTGIVGRNGCGKSTLARIAAGLLVPDGGSVSPRGLAASYCEQDASRAPERLEEFACAWDRDAVRLRADLAIDDEWAWRFDALSSGQQKRLQVAVALWESPDVLVLDEPTNHVDGPTRRAIAQVLDWFGGIGLLISHDRELLDGLVGRCLCFEGEGIVVRPGTYSEGAAQHAVEAKGAQRRRQGAKREVARLQAEATRRRNEAGQAAAKRSCRRFDPKDADGKGRVKLAIYTGKDGVAGRLSTRMDARLEKARQALDEARVAKEYAGDIWLEAEPSPRKALVRLGACELVRGEHQLAVPELLVGSTDHIGVAGPNGSGKTTLLEHLMEAVPPDLPMLYVPQEVGRAAAQRVLERLGQASRAERGRVLSIVAQLNSDPNRLLDGGEASPGELRKLMLAQGILRRPVLIVMDEPTNHLDLGSVEALERVLAAFPGALVLVSHDEPLLQRATATRWQLVPQAQGAEPSEEATASPARFEVTVRLSG